MNKGECYVSQMCFRNGIMEFLCEEGEKIYNDEKFYVKGMKKLRKEYIERLNKAIEDEGDSPWE